MVTIFKRLAIELSTLYRLYRYIFPADFFLLYENTWSRKVYPSSTPLVEKNIKNSAVNGLILGSDWCSWFINGYSM
jgi:hypothetical protein